MPAVIVKPTSLKDKIASKGIAKLVLPKASKILTNVIQLGPRVVLRSATQLLRVNPVTRIASVSSLTIVDIYLLAKKRISRQQFYINLAYSLTMFLGSTIGWYAGSQLAAQLALDAILAFGISALFLLAGNSLADKLTRSLVSRYAVTDCQRGLAEINQVCPEDIHIGVTPDQCIEVFRQNGEEKGRCIEQIILTAQNQAENGEKQSRISALTKSRNAKPKLNAD
ncbi:MAG: hypothetical protein LBB58_01300 [Cellulomonadaceae bacterium]|jgi:hypothetical protein|nr:hypothetical protein [Cellulomonadaceae bacterium]